MVTVIDVTGWVQGVPSPHIHIYDFTAEAWISSLSNGTRAGRSVLPLAVARQNHACTTYTEAGRLKVRNTDISSLQCIARCRCWWRAG